MDYELLNDIINIYEKEVRKNTKNKLKIYNFEKNKIQNINNIYNTISNYNNNYLCKYNIFLITKPKYRIVMSLNIKDKVINHYITRKVLIPKLSKYLDHRNVATRKNLGTSYGRKLLKSFIEANKKYNTFYILKLDISKYFYSIEHNVLKSMLHDKLNNKEYNFISDIISSTNYNYINNNIRYLKEKYKINYPNHKNEIDELPHYSIGKGLPIGNMTSQFLSIFYLNELDHKIIHDYKIKYYIRYMDDFILIDKNKNKLKEVYKLLKEELLNKYKLNLNMNKCKITSSQEGFIFLGYKYKVINNKTIIKPSKDVKNRIRKRIKEINYLYKNNYISFNSYYSSINTYLSTYKSLYVKRIIKKRRFNNEFKK